MAANNVAYDATLRRIAALTERRDEITREITRLCDEIAGQTWTNTHDPECPVTRYRTAIVRDFAYATDDVTRAYLHGALVEFNEGGDEEAAHCTCGVVLRGGDAA